MTRLRGFHEAFYEVPRWVLDQATNMEDPTEFAAQWEADRNMHRHPYVAPTEGLLGACSSTPIHVPLVPPCLLPICRVLASQGQKLGLFRLGHPISDTQYPGNVWWLNIW